MAIKKRNLRRTCKKAIAEALALSMCVTVFQPGGGTSILVYAAEGTGNEIIKWDFEGSQEHGWSIPENDKTTLSDLAITDGKLGATYKGDTSESWLQAGVEVFPDNSIDFDGAEKVSLDFYYNDNDKQTGNLSLKIFVQDSEWKDIISGNGTIAITNNENLEPEEIEGGLKKVTLSFDLDKTKITSTTKIGKINFSVVGQNTDYDGKVYFDNITVTKAAEAEKPESPASSGFLYDFEDNTTQGWAVVNGWGDADAINISNEEGRLKADIDYSGKASEDWAESAIEQLQIDNIDFAGKDSISFDFYYKDSLKTTGELTIKASADASVNGTDKGIISGDGCIAVTDNKDLPSESLEDGWTKKTVTFKLDGTEGESVPAKRLVFLIVGRNTNYNGAVYFDNIRTTTPDDTPEAIKPEALYDFKDGLQGWDKSGWVSNGVKAGEVTHDTEQQRLKMGIDFSGVSSSSWVGAGICLNSSTGIDFSDYNTLSFEFFYDPAKLETGNIALKASATDGTNDLFNQASSIADVDTVDTDDGLKKAVFTFKIDEDKAGKIKPPKIDIIVNGIETGYNGNIYFDNIQFSKTSDDDKDDDKYVNSTIPVNTNTVITGTDTALTVNGTSYNYTDSVKLADDRADAETVALYQYLKAVGESSSVIYGHMEDTVLKAGASGLSYSDTEDVTGSISAIDGLDCGGLFSGFADKFIQRYPDKAKELGINKGSGSAEDDIKAAAAFSNISIENGAVMTLSAHMPNFAYATEKENADSITKTYDKFDYSKANSYDTTGNCMNNLLPGGEFNKAYTAYLDLIAEYAKLVDGPVLFRPLHENTGSWFWWGSAFCSPDTYKNVFKYTADYLRNEKNIHNLLYLYGPGSEAATEAEYEERYPGDGYVDLVGFDSYDTNPSEDDNYTFHEKFRNTIKLTNEFARKHNKLFAVTETGISTDGGRALLLTGNGRKNWYNEILDIVTDKEFNCAYFMLWSNYSSSGSYYTPFVTKKNEDGTLTGHEMLDSFIKFYNNEKSIFASDQKSIISSLENIKKPQTAEKELEGYITSPVAGTRILDVTDVTVQLNMPTDKTISIAISGNGKNVDLDVTGDDTGKIYSAVITKESLDAIGETLQGKIGLYADGVLLQEISVIFNVEEKEMPANQVDDFESYGGFTNLLLGKWATNKDSGSTVDISLVEEPRSEGNYALKFAYSETKNGWAGATIAKEADWSGYNALRFFVKPDGKNQKTVVQINAGSGSYEAYLNLYDDYAKSETPLLVTLPFSEFIDKNGTKAPLAGEALKNISSFGLWVNAIQDSEAFADGQTMVTGTLYYDDIRAVSVDTDIPVFEPAGDKPAESPGVPTEKPEDKPTEKPEDKPTEKPDDKPTGAPSGSPVPTKQPGIASYPSYIVTSQPQASTAPGTTLTPEGSMVPGTTKVPEGSTAPGTTGVPSGSMAPDTTGAPSGTQAPSTTTEIKKDDVTGAVTEITTTINSDNKSTVVEKTTLADGTQNTKETITETSNGIIKITETLNSSKSNAELVKNITKYTNGTVISTDAMLYTGSSETDSSHFAKNTIPESFLKDAKEAGISNITLCVAKDTVASVKDNQAKRMEINIEVPETDGISVGKVILPEESVQDAARGNRRFVVRIINENPEDSYTVTIPPSELKKMQGDIDITINAGKVSGIGGNKQKNIESILSANGIDAENAAVVSIAANNTAGGIKASAPVVTKQVKAGDKVYVYCYNNKTGKLEEVANSKRTVLKNGMTGIEGYSGNDYVVTGKELAGKNVVTLLGQSKVSFNKTSVKKGGKIKATVTLPSALVVKTSLGKAVPYAKQAAVVKYKSSNAKVANVSKDGTVKAAGKGKAVITVQIKLADGKVKTVKKKVTVK